MAFPAGAGGKSAQEVFADVSGGVVVVIALDTGGAQIAQGSGVVVGGNEVATNCHVVAGAEAIAVRQAADARGRETWRMEAHMAAHDEARDLCLLSVAELSDPPAAPPVRLGSARALSIGEEVYAVGAPQGLTLSLSRGIVSQLRGDYGKRSAPIVQTDAPISPGSSGGGLFNGKGELVGITTFKHAGPASEGLSFATPAEWVRELAISVRERRECFATPTADCLLTAALRATKKIDDASDRASALSDIAAAQAKAGDNAGARVTLAEALQTADKIDWASQRADALHDIAAAQAKAGDIAEALQTAEKIGDASWRASVLRDIAAAQAKVGDIAEALQTAEKIGDASWRASALRDIAAAQAKAGDKAGASVTLAKARRAAEKIDEAKIDEAFSIASIMRHIAPKYGNSAAARVTLAEALQIEEKIDRAFWRADSLRDIAAAQAEAGDNAGARVTLAEALRAAEKIDRTFLHASALRAIAVAQAEAGDSAGAKATFAGVLRAAEKIDGAFLRADALRAIATAQAEAGDIAEALQTVEQIDDAFLRALALSTIAAVIAKTE